MLTPIASQYWAEPESFKQFAAYFEQFLEAVPLGLVWLDQKGFVKRHNDLARTYLSQTALKGRSWRDITHESVQTSTDLEVIMKNGRRLDVSTQAVPSLENPRMRQQLILLKDITENRKLQQRLGQADHYRELGLISATLSHQLRTPLSTALLYLEQLKHHRFDMANKDSVTDKITQQLHYMNRQISDLLFFVKGDLPVESTKTIGDIVKQVLETSRAQLKHMKLSINCDPAIAVLPVECHSDSMIGALANLVVNACEASDPGGLIQINVQKIQSYGQESGFFYFRILDHGPGFSEQALALFGQTTFSTKSRGSGIGLRFAQVVAEKHGGFLRYIAQAKGSCVSLSIPVRHRISI